MFLLPRIRVNTDGQEVRTNKEESIEKGENMRNKKWQKAKRKKAKKAVKTKGKKERALWGKNESTNSR